MPALSDSDGSHGTVVGTPQVSSHSSVLSYMSVKKLITSHCFCTLCSMYLILLRTKAPAILRWNGHITIWSTTACSWNEWEFQHTLETSSQILSDTWAMLARVYRWPPKNKAPRRWHILAEVLLITVVPSASADTRLTRAEIRRAHLKFWFISRHNVSNQVEIILAFECIIQFIQKIVTRISFA
jgi:hypothetical protein